jgi:hypothetical protein
VLSLGHHHPTPPLPYTVVRVSAQNAVRIVNERLLVAVLKQLPSAEPLLAPIGHSSLPSSIQAATFQSFSCKPSTRKQFVPPNNSYSCTRIHGVTSQIAVVCMFRSLSAFPLHTHTLLTSLVSLERTTAV